MKEKLLTVITSNKLIERGDRVLIGVSGGADSIVLLSLLNHYAPELGFELFVAHVNHGMRKNAPKDAEFVKKSCAKLGLSYFVGKLVAPSSNIEETLRNKRYEFFAQLAKKIDANKIITAHHRDDNIETALLNLMRGASFRGLSGMKLRNGAIVRPLLPFSKKEILEYARKNKLSWVEDESNLDTKFTRNKVRHSIIPLLQKETKNEFKDNFFRLMMHSREINEFISERARESLGKIENRDGTLDLRGFKHLPAVLQKEVIKLKVEEVAGDLRNVGSQHLEAAIRALSGEHSPKTVEFPKGLRIKKHSAKVSFELTVLRRKKR